MFLDGSEFFCFRVDVSVAFLQPCINNPVGITALIGRYSKHHTDVQLKSRIIINKSTQIYSPVTFDDCQGLPNA